MRFTERGGSIREMVAEARRMERFEERVQRNLDAALKACHDEMVAEVHVVSGVLKESAQWSSDIDEDGDWAGEISFGNPGIEYTAYELNRKGHGLDDVFARHEPAFEEAILRALET
jgi:hypothetical protein